MYINVIDMLLVGLSISFLMAEFILFVKALSGLQFLLNRTRILLENGSKFSLSGMYLMS